MTVAFEIYLGKKEKKNGHYRSPIITIWHVDPEKHGDDDSCGWFIRSRHIDQKLLDKVRKEFEFNFKHNYWFNEGGYPQFSTMGTALNMYSSAAWQVFMFMSNNKPTDKARKHYKHFMRKYLFDILHFAENPTDCIGVSINMKYGVERPEERISHFVSVVTADIMRKLQPWYKHPRWHIRHWKIQFHPFQQLKRRYWDKCSICGKRGFKGSACSDWDGKNIWHCECDASPKTPFDSN